MSQNTRNTGNERNGGSGRTPNHRVRKDERKRLEGFEGMNFEQVRGPYNPSRSRNDRNGNPSSGENETGRQ